MLTIRENTGCVNNKVMKTVSFFFFIFSHSKGQRCSWTPKVDNRIHRVLSESNTVIVHSAIVTCIFKLMQQYFWIMKKKKDCFTLKTFFNE